MRYFRARGLGFKFQGLLACKVLDDSDLPTF